jgi:hypothetical protein
MIEIEKEKKKGLDIRDWMGLIYIVVSILMVSTSLLGRSGNLPSWWFEFSLIFLMVLVFSVPVVVCWKPISERAMRFKKTRKEDSIARGHFKEFEGLVEKLRRVLYPISDLWNMTKQYYQTQHPRPTDNVEMLPVYLIDKVQIDQSRLYNNRFSELAERCKGFCGSKRDFSLLIDEFNRCIDDAQSQVGILSVYANEMRLSTANPQILKKYEEFREQYNIFINDYLNYCQKLNVEFGQNTFREYFETIQKW